MPDYRYNPDYTPSLRIVGNWLGDAGFQVGRTVDVKVLPGLITLTLRREK